MKSIIDRVEELGNPYLYKLMSAECNLPTNTSPYRGYAIMNRDEQRPSIKETMVRLCAGEMVENLLIFAEVWQ